MNTLKTLAAGTALSLMLAAAAIAQETKPNTDGAPAGSTAPAAPVEPAKPAASAEMTPGSPATAPAKEAASLRTAAAGATAKGHLVFFRPTRLSGAFYTYHIVEVGDDGKPAKDAPKLGDLPNGGAFAVDVEPGVHAYNITGPMAVNKSEDRLRMEVEPGETYYLEQTVRIGLFTGGFRLAPADEARFKESNAKLK